MSNNLFDNFTITLPTKWESIVEKELKKTNAAETLIWQTHEGFSVYPYQDKYYSKFTRNLADEISKLVNQQPSSEFFNIQRFEDASALLQAKKINQALNGGVNGLQFTSAIEPSQLEQIFSGVFTEVLWIEFHDCNIAKTATAFHDFLKSKGVDSSLQLGGLSLQPLQDLIMVEAKMHRPIPDSFQVKQHLGFMNTNFPKMKAIKVDAAFVANSGGNITQQIAFALSQGAEYLHWATEQGVSVSQIASQLHFNFATGTNFLFESVKIRVFRWLWAKILSEYGLSNRNTFVSSETSAFGYSIYDSHNNLLRATTATMSAILSGTNANMVLPFDSVYRHSSDFSDRTARNITNLLLEESFLGKVENPTNGSFVFDNIQEQLCENSWNLFKSWEIEGGYLNCIQSECIQQAIQDAATILQDAFKTNNHVILGVNKYPNPKERKNSEVTKVDNALSNGTSGLHPFRLANEVECERLKLEENEAQ